MDSETAVKEFEKKVKEIMSREFKSKREAVRASKKMYRLKQEYFKLIDYGKMQDLMWADHCPLCSYYKKRETGCPLKEEDEGCSSCCQEWRDATNEDLRDVFEENFEILANKIFALKE